MFFAVSKIAWFILNPGNMLLIMLCAAFAMMCAASRPRMVRAGRFVFAFVIVAFVLVTLLPLGRWMIAPLEARFPPVTLSGEITADLPAQIDGVVVLGGVLDEEISIARNDAALNGAAERLVALYRLARMYPDARIAFSGGSGRLIQPERGEAEIVSGFLDGLGVIDRPDRFVFENTSRNTYENALESHKLLRPEKNQTWLLVTSARHMPRAMGVFRQVGWEGLIAVPVDYQTTGKLSMGENTLGGGLAIFSAGLKEWIGLAAYYAAGRTNALFPAP